MATQSGEDVTTGLQGGVPHRFSYFFSGLWTGLNFDQVIVCMYTCCVRVVCGQRRSL